MSQNSPIILLYSRYSEKSEKFGQLLKEEHRKYFKAIRIDTKEMHDIILNSSVIQVSDIPCVLIFTSDGVKTYESDKALEWLQDFVSKMSPSQEPFTSSNLPTTKIEHLVDFSSQELDDEPSPQLTGLQGRKAGSVNISNPQPEAARRGPRNMDFEQGIMSNNPMERPVRGEGHENMRSSLPGVGLREDMGGEEQPEEFVEEEPVRPRQALVGRGKQAILVEELTDDDPNTVSDDSDPSGMKVPREDPVNSSGSTRTQVSGKAAEKSNSLKQMASAIASARENEEKQIESQKQGSIRQQGKMSKNRPVQI